MTYSTWCDCETTLMITVGAGFLNSRVTGFLWNCPVASSKAVTRSPTLICSIGVPSTNVPARKHSSTIHKPMVFAHCFSLSSRAESVSTDDTVNVARGS